MSTPTMFSRGRVSALRGRAPRQRAGPGQHRKRSRSPFVSSEPRDPNPNKNSQLRRQCCKHKMESLICICFISYEGTVTRVRVPLLASDVDDSWTREHAGRVSEGDCVAATLCEMMGYDATWRPRVMRMEGMLVAELYLSLITTIIKRTIRHR